MTGLLGNLEEENREEAMGWRTGGPEEQSSMGRQRHGGSEKDDASLKEAQHYGIGGNQILETQALHQPCLPQ